VNAVEGALGAKPVWDAATDALLRELLGHLAEADRFRGEVRENFTALVDVMLRFLRYRYDLEPSRASPQHGYLFGAPGEVQPEEALARDFHDHLYQYLGPARAKYEVRGVSQGRVDVLVTFASHEFVAEVKRELADASRAGLERYLGQASSYAGSATRLGILMVLDLTAHPRGPEAFDALTWVEVVRGVSADDRPRHLVVAKLLGNRGSPSSLSRKSPGRPRPPRRIERG